MIAESAVVGSRVGFVGSARSTMTTLDDSVVFSTTQMYLSDSIVSVVKRICCSLMPTSCSYKSTCVDIKKTKKQAEVHGIQDFCN